MPIYKFSLPDRGLEARNRIDTRTTVSTVERSTRKMERTVVAGGSRVGGQDGKQFFVFFVRWGSSCQTGEFLSDGEFLSNRDKEVLYKNAKLYRQFNNYYFIQKF